MLLNIQQQISRQKDLTRTYQNIPTFLPESLPWQRYCLYHIHWLFRSRSFHLVLTGPIYTKEKRKMLFILMNHLKSVNLNFLLINRPKSKKFRVDIEKNIHHSAKNKCISIIHQVDRFFKMSRDRRIGARFCNFFRNAMSCE